MFGFLVRPTASNEGRLALGGRWIWLSFESRNLMQASLCSPQHVSSLSSQSTVLALLTAALV